jgi:AraC-like DNA-binding protein
MAAIVHLSPYHFARQFKAATGLPPHQYLTTRRVERAQQLLRADGELGLAEVALRVGFSDQSQFSLHFKRIVGVTPRQFRISERTRQKSASSTKNSDPNSVGMLLDDFHARRLHGLIGCRRPGDETVRHQEMTPLSLKLK